MRQNIDQIEDGSVRLRSRAGDPFGGGSSLRQGSNDNDPNTTNTQHRTKLMQFYDNFLSQPLSLRVLRNFFLVIFTLAVILFGWFPICLWIHTSAWDSSLRTTEMEEEKVSEASASDQDTPVLGLSEQSNGKDDLGWVSWFFSLTINDVAFIAGIIWFQIILTMATTIFAIIIVRGVGHNVVLYLPFYDDPSTMEVNDAYPILRKLTERLDLWWLLYPEDRQTYRFRGGEPNVNVTPVMAMFLNAIRENSGERALNPPEMGQLLRQTRFGPNEFDMLHQLDEVLSNLARGGACERSIRRCPTHVYRKPSALDQQDNAGGQQDKMRCCICLENYKDQDVIKLLPCFHRFHEGCVDKWLRKQAVCPICKVSIDDAETIGANANDPVRGQGPLPPAGVSE